MDLDFNSLMPGAVLAARYELLDFLGSGAYGSVYKAFDRILETLCCVKILSPEASENEESRERFRREILLARRIAHRNCCQIFDLGVSGELYYILMEYVDGRDVLSLLKQKQTISVRDTLSIAYQVCSALRAAHEANVIHRDLKPQNIMVTRTGVAKIMDFGIAKGSDLSAMTRVGMAVGTPSYMSPEQCKGLDADPRSDVYSLGVVLFYMLTGTQPFRADSIPALIYMHIFDPPPLPSSIQRSIPPEVDALVLRCLAKSPADRFPTAIELRRAIAQISHKLGTNPRISQPAAASRPAPGRTSAPAAPKDASDGAAVFLEQVLQSISEPAGAGPKATAPPPETQELEADETSGVEAPDEDEEEAEGLQEITAMVTSANPQATAPKVSMETSDTDKLPTVAPVSATRAPKAPRGPAPEPVKLHRPVPPVEVPRPQKPVPAPASRAAATGSAQARPSLSLGLSTEEVVLPAPPRKGFGLKRMALYTSGGLAILLLFAVGLLQWLGLLNSGSLDVVRRLGSLLRAAGAP